MSDKRNAPTRQAAYGAIAGLLCWLAAGCVSIPPVDSSSGTAKDELAAHVRFLAQPALKGRAPETSGSRKARRYIESRFEAYGLVPWNKRDGYEVPFGYGRNIVGVLPGADTNLASEIVIVSAHYDHLGKDGKGKICPGAADNASGVAALLETARDLSRQWSRPKRSIWFVAFDSEEKMLFGSFAFTCRKDVEEAKIVAVVNADILGRNLLDVVRNTIYVAGSEHYPEIREQVARSGTRAGIRVLPVGSDLIGPVSDHVAFEARPIPCLFFSSGLYKDYHKPGDTADKLDYAELERSAKVMLATVEELANCPGFKRTDAGEADAGELHTVTSVLSEIMTNCAQAGLKPEEAKALEKLADEAERLLQSGRYDRRARTEFAVGTVGLLAPALLPLESLTGGSAQQNAEQAQALQYMQQYYISHRTALLDGYRKFVAHVLEHRPGAFRGMPPFEYEVCDFSDEDIHWAALGEDRYALNVLLTPMTLKAETQRKLWVLNTFGFGISGSLTGIDGEGTREQLRDLCLLDLRREQTNAAHSRIIRQVLKTVTGQAPEGAYPELLAQRLQQGGFTKEEDWIASCILSGMPELAQGAMKAGAADKGRKIRQAECRLIVDRSARGDARVSAMEQVVQKKDRRGLLALSEVLDDGSPAYDPNWLPLYRKDYPFADRLEVKTLRPFIDKWAKENTNASKTVGEVALRELKKATKKGFGKDKEAWRRWVGANTK